MHSKQFYEFIDCEPRIANNGTQQGLLNCASGVDWHDSSRLGVGMNEHQVAPFLPILDETRAFEYPDHLPGC
jgi:hypothetical protein